jgi:hypothetical protein
LVHPNKTTKSQGMEHLHTWHQFFGMLRSLKTPELGKAGETTSGSYVSVVFTGIYGDFC